MFEFIQLFVNKDSQSFGNKLLVLTTLLILLILVDTYTSYPSLSMLQDKYETIETMHKLLKDSATTNEERNIILKDLKIVEEKISLKEFRASLADRNILMLKRISSIVPNIKEVDNVFLALTNVISFVVSWMIYLLSSSGILILTTLLYERRRKKSLLIKTKEGSMKVTRAGMILMSTITLIFSFLITYIILLAINPIQHLIAISLFTQVIFIVSSASLAKFLEFTGKIFPSKVNRSATEV